METPRATDGMTGDTGCFLHMMIATSKINDRVIRGMATQTSARKDERELCLKGNDIRGKRLFYMF